MEGNPVEKKTFTVIQMVNHVYVVEADNAREARYLREQGKGELVDHILTNHMDLYENQNNR